MAQLPDGSSKPLISIVVPCFNEEDVLALTHRQLIETLGGNPGFALEIIYVDDGSTDATPQILDDLVNSDDRVVAVQLTRNFGHQAAVSAGLQFATGDAVAVMDADLQDPPEIILAMIEKWKDGYEIVYGIRAGRQEGWFKRFGYYAFYRVFRAAAHIEIPVDSGDFALIDRAAVDALNALPERNRFVRGLRTWVGFNQIGIPYQRPGRTAGQSKYTLRKLLVLGLNGIFNFSSKPLSLILVLGCVSSILSASGFVLFLIWRLTELPIFGAKPTDAPGFTSIVLLLFLLSGIQLMSIGIIGEYVGRIFDEIKNRPTFLARPPRRAMKDRRNE